VNERADEPRDASSAPVDRSLRETFHSLCKVAPLGHGLGRCCAHDVRFFGAVNISDSSESASTRPAVRARSQPCGQVLVHSGRGDGDRIGQELRLARLRPPLWVEATGKPSSQRLGIRCIYPYCDGFWLSAGARTRVARPPSLHNERNGINMKVDVELPCKLGSRCSEPLNVRRRVHVSTSPTDS
jgi:hypothetical protein